MRHRAVIFDLFGTLVDNLSIREHQRVLAWMADCVGVDGESFAKYWLDSFPQRVIGRPPTTAEAVAQVCRAFGVSAEPRAIAAAAASKREFTRRYLAPRDGVVGAIQSLRAEGRCIGVLSDCTPDVPALWEETCLGPLTTAAVFSCDVGVRKPAPAMYGLICQALSVSPQECLYVGDGGSRELSGAAEAGLEPVLLRAADEKGIEIYRMDPEEWTGRAISTLMDVLSLAR